MALILYFNPKNNDRERRLKEILEEFNYDLKIISMKDLDQKVGYLAEIEGYQKIDIESDFDKNVDFEFLLLKDVKKEEMYKFLDYLQNSDFYVEHKAGLTKTNKDWTLRKLLGENDDEYRSMLLINKISSLIKYSKNIMNEYGNDEKINSVIDEINDYMTNTRSFDYEKASNLYNKLSFTLSNTVNKYMK
ncbi:MAG: DUF3783 domain-containing protein [Peptoniphilaceae bacterium]|nr:DUF3783 domain-containing protein [Peptoniphilaceae bacterium]MDD7383878.1 DUF3783 domain-containing protein [Peptoniphilaceae bacterium]MDY3738019.1 DUF3783 domain-containing protein [Peptoniphilaceae bacterium]